MKKAFSFIALFILVFSCCGIGYLLRTFYEIQAVIKQIPSIKEFNNTVKVVTDIQYGDDRRQSLDIYLPPGRGGFPIVFFVHGGVWSAGDKEMYSSVGHFYAKNGYITLVVDHRLSPKFTHPAHIEDIAKAFAWTKAHITNYGGNIDKIYLYGHSSGAHLVSLLATNPRYLTNKADIKGVVAISGVYSLGVNIHIAGYGYIFPTKKDKSDASPINFIEKDTPPFLIMHAEKDITTLSSQAVKFHKELQKKGVSSFIYCIKGVNHTEILLNCITPNPSSKIVIDFMK